MGQPAGERTNTRTHPVSLCHPLLCVGRRLAWNLGQFFAAICSGITFAEGEGFSSLRGKGFGEGLLVERPDDASGHRQLVVDSASKDVSDDVAPNLHTQPDLLGSPEDLLLTAHAR